MLRLQRCLVPRWAGHAPAAPEAGGNRRRHAYGTKTLLMLGTSYAKVSRRPCDNLAVRALTERGRPGVRISTSSASSVRISPPKHCACRFGEPAVAAADATASPGFQAVNAQTAVIDPGIFRYRHTAAIVPAVADRDVNGARDMHDGAVGDFGAECP